MTKLVLKESELVKLILATLEGAQQQLQEQTSFADDSWHLPLGLKNGWNYQDGATYFISADPYDDVVVSFLGGPEAGDYGFVIITEHNISGVCIWALYGHLSSKSVDSKKIGQVIDKGEIIAWLGNESENGGWAPHLHFQLSLIKPETHDLPGVVSANDRKRALEISPDPRLVLGPIY